MPQRGSGGLWRGPGSEGGGVPLGRLTPPRNTLRGPPPESPPLPGDAGWPHRRIALGPLPLDAVCRAEAVRTIQGLVESGRGGAVLLSTADGLSLARRSAAFREALERAELSLADGQRLCWAAQLLRRPLPGDVPAADLLPPLLEVASKNRWRVFLVGEAPAQLEAWAAELERRHAVRMVGTFAPSLWKDGTVSGALVEDTARAVLRANPQLVLVALPSPAQEVLIDGLKSRLRPGVAVGLGPGLGLAVTARGTAPEAVRRLRLGWAWRLFGGPRRLGRRGLFGDLRFLWAFARVLLSEFQRSSPLP